jgi:hypothetical protein
MDTTTSHKKNFFQHVFHFDDHTKSNLLNILQYAILSIIPVVLLNKSLQRYVPEADEKKGILELSMEVVLQTVIMFVGLFFIDRIVSFVPTYSGVEYPHFNLHCIILAVLMILLSLQTRIGEKVSILAERVYELWNGKPTKKNKNAAGKASGGAGTGPISSGILSQHPIDQSSAGTSIGSLPNAAEMAMMGGGGGGNNGGNDTMANMYKSQNTPMVNANSPEGMYDGPMPANSLIGTAFGSW